MSAEQKVAVLSEALETIREATFAEFQTEMDPAYGFRPKRDVCPLCRRASTVPHLHKKWAEIQAVAADALRKAGAGA